MVTFPNHVLLAAFGIQLSYRHSLTDVTDAIVGIWRDGSAMETSETGVKASAFFVLSDLSSVPVAGDEITKASNLYRVTNDIRKDPVGGVKLMLRLIHGPL